MTITKRFSVTSIALRSQGWTDGWGSREWWLLTLLTPTLCSVADARVFFRVKSLGVPTGWTINVL